MCNFGPGFHIGGTLNPKPSTQKDHLGKSAGGAALTCASRVGRFLRKGTVPPLQSLHWDLRAFELQTATKSDCRELSISRDLFSVPFYLSLSGQWCVTETTVWL